jgi:hypothetical protein
MNSVRFRRDFSFALESGINIPLAYLSSIRTRYKWGYAYSFCQFFQGLRLFKECVRNLDLQVQVHPGELWVLKQRVQIGLEASKSAGAKGDVPKICGIVHPLHPSLTHSLPIV